MDSSQPPHCLLTTTGRPLALGRSPSHCYASSCQKCEWCVGQPGNDAPPSTTPSTAPSTEPTLPSPSATLLTRPEAAKADSLELAFPATDPWASSPATAPWELDRKEGGAALAALADSLSAPHAAAAGASSLRVREVRETAPEAAPRHAAAAWPAVAAAEAQIAHGHLLRSAALYVLASVGAATLLAVATALMTPARVRSLALPLLDRLCEGTSSSQGPLAAEGASDRHVEHCVERRDERFDDDACHYRALPM